MNRKIPAITALMLVFVFILMIYYNNTAAVGTFTLAEEDGQTAGKTVYLTFDDGPSDRITPKILDILKENQVKATFFIIGRQAETRDYLIKREIAEGHTVAVHSYTHDYNEIYSSPKALIADINKCNDVIYKITGKRADVYRFPGGSYGLDGSLISAVTGCGMRYVDWNASTCDAEWGMDSADRLFANAVATSADCNNVVLLCHDSTNKTYTPEAVKRLISYYKENGYSFGIF
ncbi:MAG: polysaccharide deacetylase [Clostridia bacterium]|nr:polysaccharide deacetylase [Clostridia bacterium]